MDRVMRHAVEQGCDPLVALQMMTTNTAQHFGVERDLGSLAPGRYADLVPAENLEDFAAGVDMPPTQPVRNRRATTTSKPVSTADLAISPTDHAPAGSYFCPASASTSTVRAFGSMSQYSRMPARAYSAAF